MGTTELLVVLLSLLGCHLFTPIRITCVEGMACDPNAGVVVEDSGGGDTMEGDSAADTAAVAPRVGMAWISRHTYGATAARLFEPDGTGRTERAPADPVPAGPFDVDPGSGTWMFAPVGAASGLADSVAVYDASGLVGVATLPDANGDQAADPAIQLEIAGGRGYALTRAAVYVFDPATLSEREDSLDSGTSTAGFEPVGTIPTGLVPLGFAVGADLTVHVLARDSRTMALNVRTFRYNSGYLSGVPDEQPINDAARAVALGPNGEPHVCENDGAVRALDGGTTLPAPVVDSVRLTGPDGVVTDVEACAWDPGDATWRLFSRTRGFLRASGAAATVLVPRDSTIASLAAGAFY